MNISVKWLNRYLEPADLSVADAVSVIEAASFPIEAVEELPGGDARLDVEVTSNRGDALCHVGLARDVAAATGRRLKEPEPAARASGGPAAGVTAVDNRVVDGGLCPRFTARVIEGVRVGPSPAWLRGALEAVGQRSINNIVDVSNYVLFELGHPSHTFDLGALAERRLVVRRAQSGEKLTALDGREHELRAEDLVVADAERAVSLAGIIGGIDTGVTERTTDVLLEVATWDPSTVRRTARRLDIRTDASHRFERVVDARGLAAASDRCVELILDVAGGTLREGLIDEGADPEPRQMVRLRASRVEHVLGKALPPEEMARLLETIGFGVEVRGVNGETVLGCAVPHFRPDVTREIDLIEEVARLHGIDSFESAAHVTVPLEIDHPPVWREREDVLTRAGGALAGCGFYETVTFSFVDEKQAAPFLPEGLRLLKVDEARRKESPFLRPSIVPSLLTCRRANQDGLVDGPGGVRLFETASVFAENTGGARETVERRNLGLLMDAGVKPDERQRAVRELRGAIDAVVRAVAGHAAGTVATDAPGFAPFHAHGTFAPIAARATPREEPVRLGYFGVLSRRTIEPWGLDQSVAVAELGLEELRGLLRTPSGVAGLPAFPAIERDLSLVTPDALAWAEVEGLIGSLGLDRLEAVEFVGSYRGKQVGAGKKSLTARLRFRDPGRTLRHEEVDPEVDRAVASCRERLGAELRA